MSTLVASNSTAIYKNPRPTSTSPHRRFAGNGSHSPVPASTVFARKAPPLYLPELDHYLSALPKPSFTPIPSAPGKGKGKESPMFPPMDLLAASGKSLEDLEHNSQVPSVWKNRSRILSTLVNWVLALTGSSALATFYSLQGLMNTIQIFALLLSTLVPRHGEELASSWRQLFLGKIPNILALNFTTTLFEGLIVLIIFMILAGVLIYLFWRSTRDCVTRAQEGLHCPANTSSGWGIVIITFVLTLIYLPLSTMAIHVLVWSDDLWVVPNPYTNATTNPPIVPPLGPSDEYRDPLDFCWTTTMKRNELNWAPIVLILAFITVIFFTFCFPLALRRVIKQSVPIVDPYTELGRRRSQSEMDREYQRLLARDEGPFAFLYNGFRRNYETYEAIYLFAKLNTLLIVAVIDPDNCLFRSLDHTKVAVARQALLVVVAVIFFLLQCFFAPFLDPVNNASEWVSRMNYISTAAVALLVILDVPGSSILDGAVLYAIYIFTYGLSLYFTIIDTSFMRRVAKKLTRRIDFSTDFHISSVRLDLSPGSIHTKRRIWQEAISTLLLTSAECAIPKDQKMRFTQAQDLEYPPYLLEFQGSPGERHVENLKILREVGSVSYNKGVALIYGPDYEWFECLEKEIQERYVGPDSYWRAPGNSPFKDVSKFFGNAWWIPFPPTLVLRYDDGPVAVLRTVAELEEYVRQNSGTYVHRKREIRMALRALDGQRVIWPYNHVQLVGAHTSWCCRGRRYRARKSVHYQTCILNVKHRGRLLWEGFQFGSGFDIELIYGKNVKVDSSIIGLNDDYDLTQPLARFLAMNQELIPYRLSSLEAALHRYRAHYRKESHFKSNVLSYRFLSYVYDRPRDPSILAESSFEFERDLRVRQLMAGSEAVFQVNYERMEAVSTSEVATWWYIFWDDVWRRNYETVRPFRLHAPDFNPHYPTSLAYTPLPRMVLETFLRQRDLLHSPPKHGDIFDSGFLNKIYLRLNEIVYKGSSRAIWFHIGDDQSELDMEELDLQTLTGPSTMGTGGGTDHDDSSIRARPAYRWEGILNDPLRKRRGRKSFIGKLGAWFGITPLWRSGSPSRGLSLDVQLDNGRYILMPQSFNGKIPNDL
ncbi:hypothetical protein NEOLEDRAFT_1053472 [Neolentinus lepideus HHB14362 ss-1]|uniref:Uncharacterized protein n=1 Tax=Neolentinus lepideus HHB14362 ss-1 TaxID=1314782 RepID=A0A165W1Q7_9AGAM|nr:hypothetical protein NEOLEDRAFT_1053472 [Neolentinus lepideus HHB14362 ss-1]